MVNKMRKLLASASLVLTVGAGVGIGIVAAANGLGTSAPAAAQSTDQPSTERVDVPPARTNASGQTYGSAINATTAEEIPDLVEAYGNNGKIGYLKKADFLGPQPANPKEAAEYMERVEDEYPKTVPLYGPDGVTQIDTFTFQAPSE
jgi:hypothetical protein